VAFTRITSKFGLRRHPILNRIRNHKGVDYAAPIGTPVKATGDAKVAFAGWQGGYGRVVQLQHEGHYMTVYGHLSRFAACAKVGQRVRLGEVIGYVGMSGLATGPHLHYEFRVKGVHRDPLTVKLPQAFPIARNRLADFKAKTQPSMALLDNASTLAAAASGKQQASSDPNSTGATQVVASATAH
jgi:murein DD-endopeptidase MepM/ murein hydrolase activator NlpD